MRLIKSSKYNPVTIELNHHYYDYFDYYDYYDEDDYWWMSIDYGYIGTSYQPTGRYILHKRGLHYRSIQEERSHLCEVDMNSFYSKETLRNKRIEQIFGEIEEVKIPTFKDIINEQRYRQTNKGRR